MRLLYMTCAILVISTSNGADTPAQKLSTANSDFALDLYKKLSEGAVGENLFFSPISISTALAMVYAGAKGVTKEQMAGTMKYGALADDTSFNAAFKDLIDDLNSPSTVYNMSMANRLFGRVGYNFRQEFLKLTEQYFMASLEELDFINDPSGSTDTINAWVEEKTNDKIKDLIPNGAINRMTALVLVNAIYFSANWENQFKEEDTAQSPFYVSANNQVNLDMMYLEKYLKYGTIADWNCRMLELPYKENGEASLFVLLPDDIDGLAQLEEKVNVAGIENAIENLKSGKIKVYLPKFKLTLEISMKAILQEMGVTDLFKGGKADLSGMNGNNDLYVTEIVHKAYVDVNERGTEAAAATGILVGVTSIQQPIPPFKVDRPAMFFIRDASTKSILFLGRLVKPPTDGAKLGVFGAEALTGGDATAEPEVTETTPEPSVASVMPLSLFVSVLFVIIISILKM